MGCSPDDAGCRETLDHIDEYLDGELDAPHVAAMRTHVEHCPHCNQQVTLEQQVRSIIVRSCTCPAAPAELRRRILLAITQLRASSSFFPGSAAAMPTFGREHPLDG